MYVLGSVGINEEIKDIGFQTLWSQEHDDIKMDPKQFEELETDPDIGAVVLLSFFSFNGELNTHRLRGLNRISTSINIAMHRFAFKKELLLLPQMRTQTSKLANTKCQEEVLLSKVLRIVAKKRLLLLGNQIPIQSRLLARNITLIKRNV